MAYAETVLPEFDQEMANTRKVLERIPDQKLDWQAHPKSHTIGWNANHLADLPNWLAVTLTTTSLDIAPVGGPAYQSSNLASTQEILDAFRSQRHRRASSTRGSQGRGGRQDVVALARWKYNLHPAAGGGGPGHGPQSHHPPSRDLVCLSSPQRHSGPRHVWTFGR